MPLTPYQAKCTMLSPELIEINTVYTITLNPSDDFQYWTNESYQARIKALSAYVELYLLKQIPAVVDIYMESSRTGRLHFHGTIKFLKSDHILEFYLMTLHKLVGKFQIEIDTIKDIKIWTTYCRKSSHLIDVNIKTNSHNLKRYKDMQPVVKQKDMYEMFSDEQKASGPVQPPV